MGKTQHKTTEINVQIGGRAASFRVSMGFFLRILSAPMLTESCSLEEVALMETVNTNYNTEAKSPNKGLECYPNEPAGMTFCVHS